MPVCFAFVSKSTSARAKALKGSGLSSRGYGGISGYGGLRLVGSKPASLKG